MATIKYKKGDIVRRKRDNVLRLITNIELGYYTLSDPDYPTCLQCCDLSCSTVDNEKVYEFVRHVDKKEYKEIMDRTLCN